MAEAERLSRDAYYMGIARAVSLKGTCTRAKVGAIVVVEDVVASTGYNGSPRGTRHCDHRDRDDGIGHTVSDMENGHCARAVHAEMNVVANAARSGASLLGGTLYVTATCCYRCTPFLVQVGIRRIVVDSEYRPDPRAFALLNEANVVLEYLRG